MAAAVVRLIAEKRGKADKYDHLRFVRSDASVTHSPMPRQGTLPHDLVHYIVESQLLLRHRFLGLVAAGADACFVLPLIHGPGNATIEIEAAQAEAIVQALQTQLWCKAFDLDAFEAGVLSASAASGIAAFNFNGLDAKSLLYDTALALLDHWERLPFHHSMELHFRAQHH